MYELIVASALFTLVALLIVLNIVQRERHIKHLMTSLYGIEDEQFMRSMSNLLGPPLVDGNRITMQVNGDQIFPAMLQAIHGAQSSITFETYIYWSGQIGDAFTEALIERAQAGVRVHVLVDWIGSHRMDRVQLRRMRKAGIQVRKYRPLHWYTLARLNNRTHRKLLVVDGVIGFIGGVGIADLWRGNAEDSQHWHDVHFCVEGPVVAQLQSAFMDNWLKTSSVVLHGDRYFPQLAPVGDMRAQIFKSSAREGSESIALMYLLSFSAARKNIRIGSPYFIPDALSQKALIAAAKRGVRVEILIPGAHSDSPIARFASKICWGRLLRNGIHIYEYQPTMYHCKMMIIDDRWASVGSVNFDARSFRLNDEANLNVSDVPFALTLTSLFEDDKKRSREVLYREWRRQSVREKIYRKLADIVSSQF